MTFTNFLCIAIPLAALTTLFVCKFIRGFMDSIVPSLLKRSARNGKNRKEGDMGREFTYEQKKIVYDRVAGKVRDALSWPTYEVEPEDNYIIRETWSEFFWNLAEHLIQERRSNTSPVVVEVFNNKEPTKVSIEMFDHRAGDIVEFLLCDQEEGHSDEYLKDLGPEGILDKCAGIAGLYNPTRERNRLTLEIGRDDLYDRDNFTVMHEIVAEEVKKWHGDKGALFYNPYITNHVLVYFFESFPETTAYYKSFCESLVYVVAM